MHDPLIDLVAALVAFIPALVVCALFVLYRHRLIRRMREQHPERWEQIGLGRHWAHPAEFGAFLFDGQDYERDIVVRDMKRRVLIGMSAALIALASVAPSYRLCQCLLHCVFSS